MVYLVVIAWMYVVLMMAVAEATHAQGSLLGAAVTFVLYGLGPVALVVYLMGTPARRRPTVGSSSTYSVCAVPSRPGRSRASSVTSLMR